jgi:hypothetical protein
MWIRLGHLAGISLLSASIAWGTEEVAVAGTWRGESLCTTAATSSCHNETVVYTIADVPNRPNLVNIRADKIVDGKAVTMGTGQWTLDQTHHTLEWRTSRQVWSLVIDGRRIEGTLTLADKTVVRKMTLTKD